MAIGFVSQVMPIIFIDKYTEKKRCAVLLLVGVLKQHIGVLFKKLAH